MKQIKILLADDHALLRRGLATLIRLQKDLTVVGEAQDGVEAVEQARTKKPDVVIMDLAMPVMDGVEATQQIKNENPKTKVLILTTFGSSADVIRAILAGASGAFVKDTRDNILIEAIRTVAAGGKAFSPDIEAMIENEPAPPELTDRQCEILELIIKGHSTDVIATMLGISPNAVCQHLDAIRKKLGAANRAEAVAIALRKQLLKI